MSIYTFLEDPGEKVRQKSNGGEDHVPQKPDHSHEDERIPEHTLEDAPQGRPQGSTAASFSSSLLLDLHHDDADGS